MSDSGGQRYRAPGETAEAGDGCLGQSAAGPAEAIWRKSSWSSYNGNCLAVAELGGELIGVRDTKDGGAGPVLIFNSEAWRSFLDDVRR